LGDNSLLNNPAVIAPPGDRPPDGRRSATSPENSRPGVRDPGDGVDPFTSTAALLEHPDQLAAVRDGDDALVANAVEELGRCYPIDRVHGACRRVRGA
jgi:hypothetical protein